MPRVSIDLLIKPNTIISNGNIIEMEPPSPAFVNYSATILEVEPVSVVYTDAKPIIYECDVKYSMQYINRSRSQKRKLVRSIRRYWRLIKQRNEFKPIKN
jgi:hypothetical protein